MAKAKAVALEEPMAGVTKALDEASDTIKKGVKKSKKAVSNAIKATTKGTSKGIYSGFYYASFGITYAVLTVFSIVVDNPIGRGIKDGATAASKAKKKK